MKSTYFKLLYYVYTGTTFPLSLSQIYSSTWTSLNRVLEFLMYATLTKIKRSLLSASMYVDIYTMCYVLINVKYLSLTLTWARNLIHQYSPCIVSNKTNLNLSSINQAPPTSNRYKTTTCFSVLDHTPVNNHSPNKLHLFVQAH